MASNHQCRVFKNIARKGIIMTGKCTGCDNVIKLLHGSVFVGMDIIDPSTKKVIGTELMKGDS